MLLKIPATLRAPTGICNKRTMRTCDKTRFRRVDVVTNGCSYPRDGTIAGGNETPGSVGNNGVTGRWAVIDPDTRRANVVECLPAKCKITDSQILRTSTVASHRAVGDPFLKPQILECRD